MERDIKELNKLNNHIFLSACVFIISTAMLYATGEHDLAFLFCAGYIIPGIRNRLIFNRQYNELIEVHNRAVNVINRIIDRSEENGS